MDKYEYKVRADEIKDLISREEYQQAAEIADTIDWRRVKSVIMLCTISDLYKINRRYDDAKNMLLLAYDRKPGGKTICYSLCELCLKTEDYASAVNYYKEFVQAAPKDPGRYILQYKLYEAQDVNLEERIGVLEELKKRDYREKWAYELAYLYHRVGLATRCVEECDELILWFGAGKYVTKAMELKMLHEPLNEVQQAKYDHRFDEPEEIAPDSETTEETPAEEPASDADVMAEVKAPYETVEQKEDDMDIQVQTMDVSQYNTINLQAELAKGLSEVLARENETVNAAEQDIVTADTIVIPEMDTESLDIPEIDEVSEDDLEPENAEVKTEEVFFGNTADLPEVRTEQDLISLGMAEIRLTGDSSDDATRTFYREKKPMEVPDGATINLSEVSKQVMREIKAETTAVAADAAKAEPPKEMAKVLSQESDGQISLVVPAADPAVEKQITGQMNIDDVLVEWERIKEEQMQQQKEEVRRYVQEQTGSMFTEFEESLRDGLLEQIESGRIQLEDAVETAEGTDEEDATEEESVTWAELGDAEEAVVSEETEVAEDNQEDYGEVEEIAEIEQEEPVSEDVPAEEEEVFEEEAVDEEPEEEESAEEEPAADSEEENPVEESGETQTEEEAETAEDASQEQSEEEEADVAETDEVISEIEKALEAVEAEDEEKAEEQAEEVISEEIQADKAAEKAVEEETAGKDDEFTFSGEEDPGTSENTEGEQPAGAERRREVMPARAMTPEEHELFKDFIQSRADKDKLVRAIDSISMAAYTGNVIVTGDEGMDTLGLAKKMIREVQMSDSNFSGKVAKISGHGINSKDIDQTIEHLKSGALIIQTASEMSDKTIEKLYKSLQRESVGIIIVLEDTRKNMGRLLKVHPELKECFTARMDLEPLSNESLANYAKQYAYEQEFSIDHFGLLALHQRIDELQTSDHNVTISEVKELVDEAIHSASRKTLGHFFDILRGKRYDDEDMIVLTEKDFY